MDTFSFIVLMERDEIETCLQYFYCQKLLEKGFRVKYRLETHKRLEKVIKGKLQYASGMSGLKSFRQKGKLVLIVGRLFTRGLTETTVSRKQWT